MTVELSSHLSSFAQPIQLENHLLQPQTVTRNEEMMVTCLSASQNLVSDVPINVFTTTTDVAQNTQVLCT